MIDERRWDHVWRHPGRGVRAVIDLDALAGNVEALRRTLLPETRFMAVVKANAYGHGAIGVSTAALEAGADVLGVATVGEGRALRGHGIRARIVVLGPADPSEYADAWAAGLEIGVGSMEGLRAASSMAGGPVHLKIDSGMRRFGLMPEEIDAAAALIRQSGLTLQGLFSHFARADEVDLEPTRRQAGVFAASCARLVAAGCVPAEIHQANSAGTLRVSGVHGSLCRVGISLYGLRPSGDVDLLPGMRPVLSLVARVQRAFSLNPGDGVSYGHTYTSAGHERAALLPLGYGDGYPRSLSNRGWVALYGRRLIVRGRVCMDQTVVGAADDVDVRAGEVVEVMGGDHGPSADELAALIGTINYEVVTAISARVPRFYVRRGQVIAVDDDRGYREIT